MTNDVKQRIAELRREVSRLQGEDDRPAHIPPTPYWAENQDEPMEVAAKALQQVDENAVPEGAADALEALLSALSDALDGLPEPASDRQRGFRTPVEDAFEALDGADVPEPVAMAVRDLADALQESSQAENAMNPAYVPIRPYYED